MTAANRRSRAVAAVVARKDMLAPTSPTCDATSGRVTGARVRTSEAAAMAIFPKRTPRLIRFAVGEGNGTAAATPGGNAGPPPKIGRFVGFGAIPARWKGRKTGRLRNGRLSETGRTADQS